MKHIFKLFYLCIILDIIICNIITIPANINQDGIQTQEFEGRDQNGRKVTVVKVSFHRNLNPDKNRVTPFEAIQRMDNMIENIINAMIIDSLSNFIPIGLVPINDILNNDNNIKDIGDIRDKKNINLSQEKIKKENISEKKNKIKDIKKKDNIINKNNNYSIYNVKEKKRQSKKERKKLFFSKICKYIFYGLIIFGFYFSLKKICEFLEIIDKPDISSVLNKNEETKQELTTNFEKKEGDKLN